MDIVVVAGWVMIVLYTLNAVLVVYQIGRPRPPISHGTAIITLAMSAAFIALIYALIQRAH